MTLKLTEQNSLDFGFLLSCVRQAAESSDPSTQIGAIIVNSEGVVVAAGCNNFPPGIARTTERLTDRETKLRLIVHAERAAILNAARHGVCTLGATLYFAAIGEGKLWGGAPCVACAIELIQAGIRRVVSPPKKFMPNRWVNSTAEGEALLAEAGVELSEVEMYLGPRPGADASRLEICTRVTLSPIPANDQT